MMDLALVGWIVAGLCAAMVGFTKTGVPGVGILVVPLLALVMPAKQSVGFLLPILSLADILAIVYWRRHVEWRQLARLLPWAWAGMVVGFVLLGYVTDAQLKPAIGGIVLALLVGSWARDRLLPDDRIPRHWAVAAGCGVLAGALSMMANAAGPVMVVYLLAMRLPKERFIGTQAWFFWVLNLSKLPLSRRLDLITLPSLAADAVLIPAILAGGLLGIAVVHRISQEAFNTVLRLLACAAAAWLCLA